MSLQLAPGNILMIRNQVFYLQLSFIDSELCLGMFMQEEIHAKFCSIITNLINLHAKFLDFFKVFPDQARVFYLYFLKSQIKIKVKITFYFYFSSLSNSESFVKIKLVHFNLQVFLSTLIQRHHQTILLISLF